MPSAAPHTKAPKAKRKSAIYVLTWHVRGRPTNPSTINVCDQMLRDNPMDVIPGSTLEKLHAAHMATIAAENRRLKLWFNEFMAAYTVGSPTVPHTDGRRGRVSTGARSEWSKMMDGVAALYDAGSYGQTQDDLKERFKQRSNGITGALSELHAAGCISRLKETR